MTNLSNLLSSFSFVGLLALANVFMTFAWYAHFKDLSTKPLWIAVLVSWSIALVEYALQVLANRIGYQHFSLGQHRAKVSSATPTGV